MSCYTHSPHINIPRSFKIVIYLIIEHIYIRNINTFPWQSVPLIYRSLRKCILSDVVGVDLFEPFYAKVGSSEVKRNGCLYTCFSTRAIHLEVLNNLETDTFINGSVRFVSRRGYPLKVWSDNGTNLVGARSELSKSLRDLDRGKVVRVARRMEIEWTFNPPLASLQGGGVGTSDKNGSESHGSLVDL